MLEISTQQFEAFQTPSREAFLDRAAAFVQEHLPPTPQVGSANMEAWVRSQVTSGNSFGLATERELMSFVLAAYFLGSDFVQDERVRRFLGSDRASGLKAEFLDALALATEAIASRRVP